MRGDAFISGVFGSPFFGDSVPGADLFFPDFFLPLVFSLDFLCSVTTGGPGTRSGDGSLTSFFGAGEPTKSGVLGVGGGDESESVKS